jgi:hypothetical protein
MSQCKNIKSKHYRNVQCNNKAKVGEFCSKHSKNPILFNQKFNISARLIQKCWRSYYIKNNYKKQGPARNYYSLATNNCELYTLDSLDCVPKKYFFSFSDSNKNIWAFDIRTLSYFLSKSKNINNPYTKEPFSPDIIDKIKNYIGFLKKKQISIMYEDNTNFTKEQIWNQNVLDVFTKMEEEGYIVNCDWFHDLDKDDHIDFYKKLYDIWNFRLNLTIKEKNLIVPGSEGKNKIFKLNQNILIEKEENWLKKNNLNIINRFISSSNDKTQRSLGVMYVLMGLCYVNQNVCESYPWIYDSIS